MSVSAENHQKFLHHLHEILPKNLILTDALRTFCWGIDASFYSLTPQSVLFPNSVGQIAEILKIASRHSVPVTFRAAGTSLSGQSATDSVLIVAGKKWEKYSVGPDAETVTVEPGIVGQRVNEILARYGKRISPDPASINSAMIGGMIINNASGMNCGVHGNSDRILKSAKIVLADGTVLDTGDKASRSAFEKSHAEFLDELLAIKADLVADDELVKLIRKKYSIKNVTGLNLLPLVRFDDPFDLIAHLLVGSEGTLAFLASATLATEAILPKSASAMVYFSDITAACRAVLALQNAPTASVELLDRKALRSVEGRDGMPDYLASLPPDATALLIETQSNTDAQLAEQIQFITDALAESNTLFPVEFTDDPAVFGVWWAIRSGIFPSVGGMRALGTTCLIEDVAFPMDHLPEATAELQALIARYGYDDGVIYGHARDGNFHFILNQRFDSEAETNRYAGLMRDVVALVADKYHGSLKAEHGTGRNMAPFVEREWGVQAFTLMKRIKKLFDPKNLLNPGVIFNDDPNCFVKNAKPLPPVNEAVDRCIECGFCEVNCVTCGLTLSSRQRIAASREIARLRLTGENPRRLTEMTAGFRSLGDATCAGDGLCSTSCPMGINVAELTHCHRAEKAPAGSLSHGLGNLAAQRLGLIESSLRPVLQIAHLGHTILGSSVMSGVCRSLHKCGVPLWTPAMPKAHSVRPAKQPNGERPKVVYFPSCINQTMGTAKGDPDPTALTDKMLQLLDKAGYDAVYPTNMKNLCCGTIWESKGMPDIADRKTHELEEALTAASENGKYPVLCDQSPCLYRMREKIKSMKLFEPVEFIETFLIDRLDFHPIDDPVAIHVTCSTRKMGLAPAIVRLAQRCSKNVLAPEEIGCCAFAGDKGFTHPEMNQWALRKLRAQLEKANVTLGFSNSRTCEIGLTTHGGVPYRSIVYLVDKVTTAKNQRETG